MRTIKEALEDGSISLEDEIDYPDMTEEEYKEEIERLHSIIKEVREYIEEMNVWCIEFENFGVESKGLLEILDKVDKENKE